MPKIQLAYPYQGSKVGDSIEVDDDTAKMLVRSGRARPANKTAAKAIAPIPASMTDKKES